MVDTVLHDTVFSYQVDTLVLGTDTLFDSTKIAGQITSRDTTMKAFRLSKAHWIYGPNDVYLRHTFTFAGVPALEQSVLTSPKRMFTLKK